MIQMILGPFIPFLQKAINLKCWLADLDLKNSKMTDIFQKISIKNADEITSFVRKSWENFVKTESWISFVLVKVKNYSARCLLD